MAASVAFARCAEHIDRFAGIFADPPAAGTTGRLLAGAGDSRNSWSRQLWHQWITALRAEAAVLARDPGADDHLAAARSAASLNPVARALTQRAESLARGDTAAVRATATAFARAGYPYQKSRSLLLADRWRVTSL